LHLLICDIRTSETGGDPVVAQAVGQLGNDVTRGGDYWGQHE